MIKFYYNNTIISPVPTISINQNNKYANDSIIGYNYSVSINGHIFPQTTNSIKDGLQEVLAGIQFVKNLFSNNGSNLVISQTENNVESDILILKHGIIKEVNFPENDNNWSKYCTYSITIEFNELIILDENVSCNNGYIDSNTISAGLVDINKYKIEEFTDGWTFSLEDDIYNFALKSDTNTNLNIFNTAITMTYTLNVTGRNYFDDNKNLSPGWIQAKNFAQKRLFDQVNNLSKSLRLSGVTNCDAKLTLSQIHSDVADPNSPINPVGLVNSLSNNYGIFDETLSCSTSESNGSFSLTYTSKLKRKNNSSFSSDDTIHTFTKELSYSSSGSQDLVNISINGTVQGLCSGGLVKLPGNFTLPNSGSLLIGPSYNSKFISANNLLVKIINTSQNDLTSSFKTALGINNNQLLLNSNCNNIIKPSSFNLTNNYMEGTISYSVEYTTDRNCSFTSSTYDRTISKTSVSVELPTPVIAEFVIPGGNFLLQDINTVTSKKVTISSSGRYKRDSCTSLNTLLLNIINNPMILLPPEVSLPDIEESTLLNKNFDYNPVDGSYSVSLSYLCVKACEIL